MTPSGGASAEGRARRKREQFEVIVYQASKRQFIQDTFENDIEFVLSQQYLRSTGRRVCAGRCRRWAEPIAWDG